MKYIILHHTAVSYEKNPDQWTANNKYHKKKWNSKSSLGYYLGYNYEISSSGTIRQARKEGERTIAVYQNNMNDGRAIHIALDGNFDIEYPTEKQKKTLTKKLKELKNKYPSIKIGFHRDWASYKSCPGSKIKHSWIKELLLEMKLFIDKHKNQYFGDELSQVIWSIPTPNDLQELKKHCKIRNIKLNEPQKIDATGWFIIRGTTEKQWKEFLNF